MVPVAPHDGALVSLVAPAGPLGDGGIERAVERVRSFGWRPIVAPHASRREGYLAGTDTERVADLQSAIDGDSEIIWCLRGGYGTMRIADRLDLAALARRPRPLIGFSDNTVLHLLARKAGVISFHGPHAGVAEFPEFTRSCLAAVMSGWCGCLPRSSAHPAPVTVRGGHADGRLVGGNLALLAATIGTPLQVEAAGAILFLEDVGEPGYRLDRLLTQLILAGVMDRVAGIAVGALSDCQDEDPSLPTPLEVVRDRLAGIGVPVVSGFPFGHTPETWTLPLGVRARLDADACTLELLEPAVSG